VFKIPSGKNSTLRETNSTPRVILLELPPCPVDPKWDALARKRRLWWHHQQRNRIVGKLAVALARGDVKALRASGVRLSPEERRGVSKGWRVAVLVESLRHAAVLLELLPGWGLLDAVPDDCSGEGGKSGRTHTTTKMPAGTIITLTRAWKDEIDVDVLLRATGGRGRLLLDGSEPQGVEVAATAARLVVDFVDSADAGAARDTACRVQDYRDQDLTVTEPGPTT
jgi:hypothetical protein